MAIGISEHQGDYDLHDKTSYSSYFFSLRQLVELCVCLAIKECLILYILERAHLHSDCRINEVMYSAVFLLLRRIYPR